MKIEVLLAIFFGCLSVLWPLTSPTSNALSTENISISAAIGCGLLSIAVMMLTATTYIKKLIEKK